MFSSDQTTCECIIQTLRTSIWKKKKKTKKKRVCVWSKLRKENNQSHHFFWAFQEALWIWCHRTEIMPSAEVTVCHCILHQKIQTANFCTCQGYTLHQRTACIPKSHTLKYLASFIVCPLEWRCMTSMHQVYCLNPASSVIPHSVDVQHRPKKANPWKDKQKCKHAWTQSIGTMHKFMPMLPLLHILFQSL